MEYIIVSTSKCKYQEWQIRALFWSIQKTNQQGKLILLLSDDINHQGEVVDFNFDSSIEIHELPDWAKEWEINEGEWWGGIPNKYEAIKWLTENREFNPEDRLLFLDPDMIFLEPINLYPGNNEIIAQEWIGAYPAYPDRKAFMYPFALKAKTLLTFIDTYKNKCIEYRRNTKEWISEMYGLDDAAAEHNINIKYIEDLGRCTAWNEDRSKNSASIIHYPNQIDTVEGDKIFFKQDYTFNLDQVIECSRSRNLFDNLLLSNIDQERTNFRYYTQTNSDHIFKFYTGEDGYVLFEKWPGGFNNIRMSFELAACISFLLNRTLVIPPKQDFYLLEGECSFEDFFDFNNLGIKWLDYSEFAKIENKAENFNEIKETCQVFNAGTDNLVYNFEPLIPPQKFLKGRRYVDIVDEIDSRYVYFDKNLLGSFYQVLYTKQIEQLKEFVCNHIRFKNTIFDISWLFINELKDKEYYSIHVRKNDFQYKDLHIPCETIYENIKDEIPENSKLYIATDHKDQEFFKPLSDKYEVYFYEDLLKKYPHVDIQYNWIPIIEKLICTRSKTFIGTKLSTLSSYVYRLRGYMNDIEDNRYCIVSEKYNQHNDKVFEETEQIYGGWGLEFPNVWSIDRTKIFVSIASYSDSEIFNTLKNLYKYVSNVDRMTVCVNLQDTESTYEKLKQLNYRNLKIIYTRKEDASGVVDARNKIKDMIENEPYFLQVDSHSRFKKNWDLILINQYNSIEDPKVILTTYPNEYHVPDEKEEYLNLPYNSPLRINRFQHPDSTTDNRCKAGNYPPHEEKIPFNTEWCAAGFLFTRSFWTKEVRLPGSIRFTGEEDFQTFISFLKGWNLRVCSEAVVWHNYNFLVADTGMAYRKHNDNLLSGDNSAEMLNEALLEQGYERTIEDLESYFKIKLRL